MGDFKRGKDLIIPRDPEEIRRLIKRASLLLLSAEQAINKISDLDDKDDLIDYLTETIMPFVGSTD